MPNTPSVVLLIEPSDQPETVYADALRDAGFMVAVVCDCAAAIHALAEVTPQIVIVGFGSRTHDESLAFCGRLKSDPRTRAIPILLTSQSIDGDDWRRVSEMRVLGMTLGQYDGAKITGAVRGVLAASQPDRPLDRSA